MASPAFLAGIVGAWPAAAQMSAGDRLEAGDVPYAQWSLDEASADAVAEALGACVEIVEAGMDQSQALRSLADDGWRQRAFPEAMAPFLAEVSDERWQGLRVEYDDAEEWAADRAGDPYRDPSSWSPILTRPDSPVMLSVSSSRFTGPHCRLLTRPAPSDQGDPSTIFAAIGALDRPFSENGIRTPHGFRWEHGGVIIMEDYGNGIGGAYRYFPPVFDHFVPNLSVFRARNPAE